jgi:hypothetical protein
LRAQVVEKLTSSIQEPEVQEMLKRLSNYGLGVFMPHMHAESGAFVELPRGMVQVEDNLRVSFKPRSDTSGRDSIRSLCPIFRRGG